MCLDLGRGFMDDNTPGRLRKGSSLSVTRAHRCLFYSSWPFAQPCEEKGGGG